MLERGRGWGEETGARDSDVAPAAPRWGRELESELELELELELVPELGFSETRTVHPCARRRGS